MKSRAPILWGRLLTCRRLVIGAFLAADGFQPARVERKEALSTRKSRLKRRLQGKIASPTRYSS